MAETGGIDLARVTLTRELSARHERFVVWKHLERSLSGIGDIDALAPRADAEAVTNTLVEVASTRLDVSHVFVCDHVPNVRMHFLVEPRHLPELLELDIWMQPSRGASRWADPTRVPELAELGLHQVRTLRPGAEAVMLLVYQGLSWNGKNRLPAARDRRTILSGLAADPDGARQACTILPPKPARAALRTVVQQVSNESWSRSAAIRAFTSFNLAGLAAPSFAVGQAKHRARFLLGRECKLFGLMRRHERTVPPDGLDSFVAAVRSNGHAVFTL